MYEVWAEEETQPTFGVSA